MNLWTTATAKDEDRRGARVAVLPIGSFEQHGAYLPLSTDSIVAGAIAKAVADHYDLFLLPPITMSCSHEHASWRATVSISARTLMAVIDDVMESLRRSGVDRIVLVNGHGGNYVLSNIVQEANVDGPRLALFPSRADWERARKHADLDSSSHDDMHAGEIETSILLQVDPDLVRDGNRQSDHIADRPHLLMVGMQEYTPTGVIGRPSLGTAAKGKSVLDSLTEGFADTLAVLTR